MFDFLFANLSYGTLFIISFISASLGNTLKGIVKLEKGARYCKASQEPSDEISNTNASSFYVIIC